MELQEELFPPEKPQRLGFLDLCYGVLITPRETLARVAQTEPLVHALVILVTLSILNSIVNFFIIMPQSLQQMEGQIEQFQLVTSMVTSPGFLLIITITSILGGIIGWLLKSGIYQLLAELVGGKGRTLGVMAILGCSVLPTIFSIPIQLLGDATQLEGLLWTLNLPILLWAYVILPVIGLQEAHQISTARAVAVVLSPIVIMFGLIIVGVILMAMFFAGMASQFQGF